MNPGHGCRVKQCVARLGALDFDTSKAPCHLHPVVRSSAAEAATNMQASVEAAMGREECQHDQGCRVWVARGARAIQIHVELRCALRCALEQAWHSCLRHVGSDAAKHTVVATQQCDAVHRRAVKVRRKNDARLPTARVASTRSGWLAKRRQSYASAEVGGCVKGR